MADPRSRKPRVSRPADPPGRRLAAIDVGSHAIRLVVAEAMPDGTTRVLAEETEAARIGAGLAGAGRLSEETMSRSVAAVGRLVEIARGHGVETIEAIATSAVRDAANGATFRRRLRDRCGLELRAITADEEARLAFRAARRDFPLAALPVAVVDVGGGSTEVVLAAGPAIAAVDRLPLGAVWLTEQYARSDPLSGPDFKALRRAVRRAVRQAIQDPPIQPQVLIGSGGTFRALARVALAMDRQDGRPVRDCGLCRADVRHVLEYLRALPLEARLQVPGLNSDEADLIVAGLVVLDRLMKHLRVDRVQVTDRGVRDGLLETMVERLGGPRPVPDRMAAARRFAGVCGAALSHCDHVARLALEIFDGLREPLHWPGAERPILEAAALLHDLGYLVSSSGHHKHSYHLIIHGDLPGFSAREVQVIASVARYHRGAEPRRRHGSFAALSDSDRRTVRRLGAVLRLAEGLDHTHTQAIRAVRCELCAGTVWFHVAADRDPEVELRAARRKSALFEKLFKVRVELLWELPAAQTVNVAGSVSPVPGPGTLTP